MAKTIPMVHDNIPAGCTQVFGMPSSFIQVPRFPTWVGGLNTEWSASLNITGKPYIWVYAQTQHGPIEGPLTVTPTVQGSDNSVKTCVKAAGAAGSASSHLRRSWPVPLHL
ncbi:MAG: hypothetical protein J6575_07630 [Bifidobacterium sp.]|nr:hypothetical protein [Bifidobacterium sp.]